MTDVETGAPARHSAVKVALLHRYTGRRIWARPDTADGHTERPRWVPLVSTRRLVDEYMHETVRAQIVWDGVTKFTSFLPNGDVEIEVTDEEWATQVKHYAQGGYHWTRLIPPDDWTLDQQASLW